MQAIIKLTDKKPEQHAQVKNIIYLSDNLAAIKNLTNQLTALNITVQIPADFDISLLADQQNTGLSYVNKARLKILDFKKQMRLKYKRKVKNWGPIIALESGLEVYALQGSDPRIPNQAVPGIYSQRYAQMTPHQELANNAKLLSQLNKINAHKRKAALKSIAVIDQGSQNILYEEQLKGTIAWSERGAYGRGYELLFQPQFSEKTLAELTPSQQLQLLPQTRIFADIAQFYELNQKK